MTDEAVKLVDEEIAKILKKMGTLVPGSPEYVEQLNCINQLSDLINQNRKSRADVTRACVEADKQSFTEEFEKKKQDFFEENETEKMELEKGKLELDKDKLKAQKMEGWIDAGKEAAKLLGIGVITAGCIRADMDGSMISKVGMAFLPKPKL